MGAPIFTLAAFGGTGNFSSSMTSPQHQPVSPLFGINPGWIPHITGEVSHLVWVSLCYVDIG